MKGSKMLLAFVGIMLVFTSCKKNYTCSCIETVSGSAPVNTNYTINDTKSGAKSKCDSKANNTLALPAPGTTVTFTCALQ